MPKIAPVLICVGITAACLWCGLAAIFEAGSPPPVPAGIDRSLRNTPPAARASGSQREPVVRHDVSHGRSDVRPPAEFDRTVERLVALGVQMWRALEAEEHELVEAWNTEAEDLLRALRAECLEAGELALDRLTRVGPGGGSIELHVRRHVLERILRDVLASRHDRVERGEPCASVDDLVSAMLAMLPQSAELAQGLGERVLVDAPFLGSAHEHAVLALADMVPETPYLETVVAGLLRTLWQNLEATGARSSARLASLAMLLVDDANPSRRRAALLRLLHDARYRDFAVAQVVRCGDRDLARELAQTASAELPPADALDVLHALDATGGEELLGAWLLVGSRDARLLARHYEQVLADGVRPQLRASLVTGACARGDRDALEVARVAYHHDPDPDVRLRALYALAGHPDAEIAEQAIATALDDPRLGNDAGWVESVALALRNLAASGATNALARLGRRLEHHPLLDQAARDALRALLTEHLPDHG